MITCCEEDKEVPLEDDNTLSLNVLQTLEPTPTGLQYLNPATNRRRTVHMENSRFKPRGDWEVAEAYKIVCRCYL